MPSSPDTLLSDLHTSLEALQRTLSADLTLVRDGDALEALRVAYLGRSGRLTTIRRGIGSLPVAERPEAGRQINEAAARIESSFAEHATRLSRAALDAESAARVDVTGTVPWPRRGALHPLRQTIEAIVEPFQRRGFAVVLGTEIEEERTNFDALNIGPDHPAREGLDSFYLAPGTLLRTHTSPMQIRMMERHPAPVALLVPGAVYRRDAVDARHSPMFHQVEGLCVGEHVHFGHLREALLALCRHLFGAAQHVRLRPSFFPFTEPSAEVDTSCPGCDGSGCRTCGGSGWIEIGGAGMVHPQVLRNVGYDPERLTGWAFGVGVERIAMVRYGIDDIRTFFENDRSLLEQLG